MLARPTPHRSTRSVFWDCRKLKLFMANLRKITHEFGAFVCWMRSFLAVTFLQMSSFGRYGGIAVQPNHAAGGIQLNGAPIIGELSRRIDDF